VERATHAPPRIQRPAGILRHQLDGAAPGHAQRSVVTGRPGSAREYRYCRDSGGFRADDAPSLTGYQAGVHLVACHELMVLSGLCDPPALEHDDAVRGQDGR